MHPNLIHKTSIRRISQYLTRCLGSFLPINFSRNSLQREWILTVVNIAFIILKITIDRVTLNCYACISDQSNSKIYSIVHVMIICDCIWCTNSLRINSEMRRCGSILDSNIIFWITVSWWRSSIIILKQSPIIRILRPYDFITDLIWF